MIKSVNAIVANGTVGRPWRSEDFTSKAVLLFHAHAVYFDFLDTWLERAYMLAVFKISLPAVCIQSNRFFEHRHQLVGARPVRFEKRKLVGLCQGRKKKFGTASA